MKVSEILKNAESTLFTFELLPPMKGNDFGEISTIIDQLLPYAPAYVNVTSHRAEVVLVEHPNGLLEKHVVRKRPGTVGVAASIKFKYGIPVVPHLICGGFNREDTEDALIDLQFLGINNVLALRGDAVKGERAFTPEPKGNAHADELVEQIEKMNKGQYLDPNMKNTAPTDFCVGVAGYPEKHCEAPNLMSDLHYLKAKVDAGAEYIVTQMFFDNKHYFNFVKACREIGIQVPIIPGLKPISMLQNLNNLPQIFHIDLPEDLVKAVKQCKNNAEVAEVGVEWAIAQSKELKENNVPCLHFFTLGSTAKNIARIAKAVF